MFKKNKNKCCHCFKMYHVNINKSLEKKIPRETWLSHQQQLPQGLKETHGTSGKDFGLRQSLLSSWNNNKAVL